MNEVGEKFGWLAIILGGILQIVWAIGLDYTDGFVNVFWDAVVIVFLFLSIWCLSFSMKAAIPVSTAYTVWIGLGVVGTIAVSAILGLETLNLVTAVFLAVIVGGVIGLKMTPAETE
ncbi:MAG: QacE family quaternary ammonium compound efflux SMR transporter [Candidatus Methanoplasma sp.]|jgi:quaternary ammonium compound-resistance protein SugE|nr:QacE family quaternary ammonium compound efflux SMR transporter [Candidatus Methanoplasma sp.]